MIELKLDGHTVFQLDVVSQYKDRLRQQDALRNEHLTEIANLRDERDALKADAERYRWLFGARTADECASEDVGLKPPLTQDLVLADLSGFYSHKELVDDMIDTAMKGKS